MIRASIVSLATGSFALCLFGAAACDKPANEQARADQAQAEANEKIVQANREAVVETRSAQLEADEKIAEANREANREARGAQLEADKEIAAAQRDFSKRREDYRHDLETKLIDVDKKIEVLEAKSAAATGKAKAELDQKLASVRARRASLRDDAQRLDAATATTWDDAKARVDKELSELKSTVESL